MKDDWNPIKCPEKNTAQYFPIDHCNLNDKPCVREMGYACPIYEEFLEKHEIQ